MKILIDCSNLRVGGGIQVASSFINDLNYLNNSKQFIVLLSPEMKGSFNRRIFTSNFSFIDVPRNVYKTVFSRKKFMKLMEAQILPNIVFTVFGPSYHRSRVKKIVGFAIPHLIYPDSPFFKNLSVFSRLKIKVIGFLKQRFFILTSDAIIFETENAKNTFVQKTGYFKPCYVVANTLNEVFLHQNKWMPLNVDSSMPNILCLAANYPHKNLKIIPQVIDYLISQNHKEFKFILTVNHNEVGFPEKYNEYIVYLGRVKIESIPSLYRQCDILFLPTLLEVFSTTYLEAMFMKVPIVTSDLPFARDICSDGALFCDPIKIEAYGDAIISLFENHEERQNLIERGLKNYKRFGTSMDRTKKYIEIITHLSQQKSQSKK